MKNLTALHLGLALVVGACGTNEEIALREQLQLESGGYEATDEAPMFGLEEEYVALGEAGEDPETSDPVATRTEVMALDASSSTTGDIYYLLFGAGYLQPGHEAVDVSGSLSASRGALVVLRAIRHTPDDEILPRTDPTLIEWNATAAFVNGLLVKIIDDPNAGVAGTVTLKIGAVEETFTVDELAGMARMTTLASGFRVAAAASILDPDAQAGFCAMRFRSVGEDIGRFRGRWIGQHGFVRGHLAGIYGVKDGQQVFFGKYVSQTGVFRGLLRGTYGDNAFNGTILNAAREPIGELEGRYSDDGFGICRWSRSQP